MLATALAGLELLFGPVVQGARLLFARVAGLLGVLGDGVLGDQGSLMTKACSCPQTKRTAKQP